MRPSMDASLRHRFCVAPMMGWTDRHCRYFHRLLSRRAVLYTEMVGTEALLRGDAARLLAHHPAESPVALQLGGSDPRRLAACARLGEEAGYDEINLNVGCPSHRVREGGLGACLFLEPQRVAEAVAAMAAAVRIPVTVKTRVGVDRRDRYEDLLALARLLAQAGCTTLVVHARKAWLEGLSPKDNRTLPPLEPHKVHALKADLPGLEVVLNGGLASPEAGLAHLAPQPDGSPPVDGVMLGRAAYHDPYLLARVDALYYGEEGRDPPSREAVAEAMLAYVEDQARRGVPPRAVLRHLLGLYHGVPGARRWRRLLSGPRADADSLRQALAAVRERAA